MVWVQQHYLQETLLSIQISMWVFSCDDAQAEIAICSIFFYWSLFHFGSAFLLQNSNTQQVYQSQLLVVCEHHVKDMFFLSSTRTADH